MLGRDETTTAAGKAWDVGTPLLKAMYGEFQVLSRKNPDGAVSKAKISVVNRLLEKCREALHDEDSLSFLDLLDEDDLPLNSDLVLMLSQYDAAMQQFYTKYHQPLEGWSTEDDG